MFIQSRRIRAHRSGFTLIELMVVIAIIGILAAILTPVLIRARFKTYHSACIQNERNLATSLELYSLENGQIFPDTMDILALGPSPYITHIEDCPSSGISYETTYTVDNGNTEYVIACPGDHEVQLPGVVEDTYPQMANGILNQYNASR